MLTVAHVIFGLQVRRLLGASCGVLASIVCDFFVGGQKIMRATVQPHLPRPPKYPDEWPMYHFMFGRKDGYIAVPSMRPTQSAFEEQTADVFSAYLLA